MSIISHSDIKRFKRCRRKFHWASRLGRYLRPKTVQPAFYLGSAVHHALEVYYGEGEDPVQAVREWCQDKLEEFEEEYNLTSSKREELEEDQELAEGMLEHYKEWAPQVDSDYFSNVVETEKEGTVDIPGTDHQFLYIIDGLVQDEMGLYWIMEHKTASRMQTDHLDQDEQILKYIWAAQKDLGVDIAGVVYTILKKKVPSEPRVLKDGSLSKAKNQSVTYSAYKQAVKDHHDGEIPEEYRDILQHFKKGGNDFFFRDAITRSRTEIEEAEERLVAETKDMTGDFRVYPNPTKACQWDCSYTVPCRLKSLGQDYEAELQHNFEQKERDDE